MRKAHIYAQTQFNPEVNIFGTLDRERHRHKRKIYGTILSERSLRIFEPVMVFQIHTFLREILKQQGQVTNMSPLCERLATDIAGHLAFGQPLNTLTEDTNRLFPRAMLSMNAVVNLFSKSLMRSLGASGLLGFLCSSASSELRLTVTVAWPLVAYTWPLLSWLSKKRNGIFSAAVRRIITARMALPRDAKHDFYSLAAPDDRPSEQALGRSELWAEAVFILPAGESLHMLETLLIQFNSRSQERLTCLCIFLGGTTTSAALSTVFFYLSRNLDAYTKLAAEVRSSFASVDDIKMGPQLAECKYLRAVIDESMRMSPPFLGTFWRQLPPSTIIDGQVIPDGIMVGVNPYCLMHNEIYFPKPFTFRPERWLEPEPGTEEIAEHTQARLMARRAFAPFALGDTSCLGKGLAYHEMSLAIAQTLWCFDFESASGEQGKVGEGKPGGEYGRHRPQEYQLLDIATADHDGPNLVFKSRGDYWQKLVL